MRITGRMSAEQLAHHLGGLRRDMDRLQNQVASGRRLEMAQDDPVATVDAMRVRSALHDLDQYEAQNHDATDWLAASEGALDRLVVALQRARELTVQGANGTLPQDALGSFVVELQTLKGEMLEIANSQHGGKALFAGFQTGVTPFAEPVVPPAARYVGDTGAMQREVGPGVVIAANMTGDRLLAGGDFLTTIDNLIADLQAGNSVAAGARLAEVDAELANASLLRTEVGSRMRRLEQTGTWYMTAREQYAASLDKAEGVDMERSLLDLNLADTTYRAALQVGGRLLPPSLVDFLR